jgi:hypothetical protein
MGVAFLLNDNGYTSVFLPRQEGFSTYDINDIKISAAKPPTLQVQG